MANSDLDKINEQTLLDIYGEKSLYDSMFDGRSLIEMWNDNWDDNDKRIAKYHVSLNDVVLHIIDTDIEYLRTIGLHDAVLKPWVFGLLAKDVLAPLKLARFLINRYRLRRKVDRLVNEISSCPNGVIVTDYPRE